MKFTTFTAVLFLIRHCNELTICGMELSVFTSTTVIKYMTLYALKYGVHSVPYCNHIV